jgi:hypothetical protein
MTWPVSVPTRAPALRGAEILVIPAGLNKRSIENVVEPGGRGLAFIAAPEELL